jgi:anti-sigma B factor antagonist
MKLDSRTYADTLVVAPAGRLDHDNCEAFRAGLQPLLDQALASRQRIVVDLSGLEYVSSAGLRCFMLAAKQAGTQGGKIVLAALRPVVAEIFQISRFDMVFELHPSVREALAAVSPDAAAAFDRG